MFLEEDVSPFAELMRTLRVRRGLRQADLAGLLGCNRRSISVIENGEGIGARLDLVGRLGEALALTPQEQAQLIDAARRSQRTYTIPEEAPTKAYDLVNELFERLDRLTALEIDAIRIVLSMHSDRQPAERPTPLRVARRDKVWRSEANP
jgi:transcriptional regulator with XRE-family HTH domain